MLMCHVPLIKKKTNLHVAAKFIENGRSLFSLHGCPTDM